MDSMLRKERKYIECRFLIPAEFSDAIRGPLGNNLKRLNMVHRSFINISDSATAERILIISGFDLIEACRTLQDVLEGLGPMALISAESNECGVSLLLDETQIEYLTSDKQYELNDLLEESGTNVDVFVMKCPRSSDRVIRVRGQPEMIANCIFGIQKLLERFTTPNVYKNPYNADNAEEQFISDYGGFKSNKPINSRLEPGAVWEEPISVDQGYGGSAGPSGWRDEILKTNAQFSIPIALLPVFRVNNGARISQVESESGAVVTLDRDTDSSSGYRTITITGAPPQIVNARLLLQMCIRFACIRVD